MQKSNEVPGEDEGMARYFAQSFDTRKLIVDLCVELYEMNGEEQFMLLSMARTYRKNKPVVAPEPTKRPSYLRLVA